MKSSCSDLKQWSGTWLDSIKRKSRIPKCRTSQATLVYGREQLPSHFLLPTPLPASLPIPFPGIPGEDKTSQASKCICPVFSEEFLPFNHQCVFAYLISSKWGCISPPKEYATPAGKVWENKCAFVGVFAREINKFSFMYLEFQYEGIKKNEGYNYGRRIRRNNPELSLLDAKTEQSFERTRWHLNCACCDVSERCLCLLEMKQRKTKNWVMPVCWGGGNYYELECRGRSPGTRAMGLFLTAVSAGGTGAEGVRRKETELFPLRAHLGAPATQFSGSAHRRLPFPPPPRKQTLGPQWLEGGESC